eukprot:GHVO01051152.1.p1 GENE.GHVO01051152.1~~GHVO01051152.1.p1  ORF type:complete len:472 (-),score=44.76 GHVO01051152.1:285-1700(-)
MSSSCNEEHTVPPPAWVTTLVAGMPECMKMDGAHQTAGGADVDPLLSHHAMMQAGVGSRGKSSDNVASASTSDPTKKKNKSSKRSPPVNSKSPATEDGLEESKSSIRSSGVNSKSPGSSPPVNSKSPGSSPPVNSKSPGTEDDLEESVYGALPAPPNCSPDPTPISDEELETFLKMEEKISRHDDNDEDNKRLALVKRGIFLRLITKSISTTEESVEKVRNVTRQIMTLVEPEKLPENTCLLDIQRVRFGFENCKKIQRGDVDGDKITECDGFANLDTQWGQISTKASYLFHAKALIPPPMWELRADLLASLGKGGYICNESRILKPLFAYTGGNSVMIKLKNTCRDHFTKDVKDLYGATFVLRSVIDSRVSEALDERASGSTDVKTAATPSDDTTRAAKNIRESLKSSEEAWKRAEAARLDGLKINESGNSNDDQSETSMTRSIWDTEMPSTTSWTPRNTVLTSTSSRPA